MCIYPQSHTHTHRHTPSPKWLIIAVKKPHPTLGVSRPHAAEAARANTAQGLPAPGPELNPQKSPGPPAQVQGLEWCRAVASDRHGSRGDTRHTPGRAQGHGPAAPDTDSPQGQADTCTHTSSMPPGGQNQAGGPEGHQALARHEGAPHPLRTISEKGPPEQDGGPGTTWPPSPSPSSVHPQPHPGPAPTQTEGPGGSPPRPSWSQTSRLAPTHAHHPLWLPALGTSCLKSLYPGKACQSRARTLGLPAVLEPQPPWVPRPGRAHRAGAPGWSDKDVLRLRLPLLLPGSWAPEHGGAQGHPTQRSCPDTPPGRTPGAHFTEVEVTSGFLQRYKTHNAVHVCGAVSSQAEGRLEDLPPGAQAARWPGRGPDPGSARTQPGVHGHLCPPQGRAAAGDSSVTDMRPPCHTPPGVRPSSNKGHEGRLRAQPVPSTLWATRGVDRGATPLPGGTPSRCSSPHQQMLRAPRARAPSGDRGPKGTGWEEARGVPEPPPNKGTTRQAPGQPQPHCTPRHLRPPRADTPNPTERGKRHSFVFRFAKTLYVCLYYPD